MAETAKILSPKSIVLHPNPHSGCPMADMASAKAIREYKQTHPDTTVVAYVNTTAETKTAVDICCTSGNAEKVIASIPPENDILCNLFDISEIVISKCKNIFFCTYQ